MAQGRVGMAADVSVVAMTPDLGAEIRGVDLASPLSDACFGRILEAFHRYCVIVVRGQSLDPRLLVRFAARFGEPQAVPGVRSMAGLPQVSVIGDAGERGSPSRSAHSEPHWRTDGSYLPQPPLATLLYAAKCPAAGGSIEFVNLHSVLSALPREKQLFVERLKAVHKPALTQSAPGSEGTAAVAQPSKDAQGTEHPLVRVHPVTRRKALYLARSAVSSIPGLAPNDARRLIEELEAFATQPRFVYSHRWRTGDLIVWDSRSSLHRMTALEREHDGILHRVQVRGEVPIPAVPETCTAR